MSSREFDEKSLIKIAHLSKLNLSQQELTTFSKQMNNIIEHFNEIAKINTDNVEPLISPSENEYFLREDIVKTTTSTDEIVQNAPDKQGFLFKVPPVI